MAESDRRGVLIGGMTSSSSLGEKASVLEEEGVLRCCLNVFVPSAAFVIVVTAENAGPNVVSILVAVGVSAGVMLAEKQL